MYRFGKHHWLGRQSGSWKTRVIVERFAERYAPYIASQVGSEKNAFRLRTPLDATAWERVEQDYAA